MAFCKIMLAIMLTINFLTSLVGIGILKDKDKDVTIGIIWNIIMFILFVVIVSNREFF